MQMRSDFGSSFNYKSNANEVRVRGLETRRDWELHYVPR